MVNVFVLGATGFIGFPTAIALRRAGYTVHGLARSKVKAKTLVKEEIIPVIGDVTASGPWIGKVAEVDVVVDCVDGPVQIPVFQVVKEAVKQRGPKAPKLLLIHCSGTWIHGDSFEPVNDLTPPRDSPEIVRWRLDHEKNILNSRDILDVIIVRPGVMFGGSGSLCSMWWDPVIQARSQGAPSATVCGRRELLVHLTHRDDLAEAFCLFVAKGPIISQLSNPVFDIGNDGLESLGQIIDATNRVLEYTGLIEYAPPRDTLEEGMCTCVVTNSGRARDLLGWYPRHPTLTGEIEVYVKAFLASV